MRPSASSSVRASRSRIGTDTPNSFSGGACHGAGRPGGGRSGGGGGGSKKLNGSEAYGAPPRLGQVGVWPYTDDDQHHVDTASDGRPARGHGVHLQPTLTAALSASDSLDRGFGQYFDAVVCEFGVDERAEFGIDGWQHLRQLLHLGDREALATSASAISSPM
jgi:hypothetical protein